MSAVIDVFVWLFWLMFIVKKHSFHITYCSYKGKVNPVNFNHHVRVSLWEAAAWPVLQTETASAGFSLHGVTVPVFLPAQAGHCHQLWKKKSLTRQWYLNFQLGLNSTGQPDRRVADMTSSDQHSVLMWTVEAGVHRNGLPRRQYKCGKALSGSQ